MIDLGLSKLALIGVVALVVIGPEKLPKVARMAGSLFGRAQRYLSEIKSEVSREIALEELRKVQEEAQEIVKTVQHAEEDFRQELSDLSVFPEPTIPSHDSIAAKAKQFHKRKLLRASTIPAWYKQHHAQRTHVISGAARVAKYRRKIGKVRSFFQ